MALGQIPKDSELLRRERKTWVEIKSLSFSWKKGKRKKENKNVKVGQLSSVWSSWKYFQKQKHASHTPHFHCGNFIFGWSATIFYYYVRFPFSAVIERFKFKMWWLFEPCTVVTLKSINLSKLFDNIWRTHRYVILKLSWKWNAITFIKFGFIKFNLKPAKEKFVWDFFCEIKLKNRKMAKFGMIEAGHRDKEGSTVCFGCCYCTKWDD